MEEHIIPIMIGLPSGDALFTGVWDMNHRNSRKAKGSQMLAWMRDQQVPKEPCFVVGDFNSNRIWDSRRPLSNFSRRLEHLQLWRTTSAYHTFFKEDPGHETRFTHFRHKSTQKPYHIDYCFVPETHLPGLQKVEVGDPASWLKLSDHSPLIVDLKLA